MIGQVEREFGIGPAGGNHEKTWLWDIKGTPCGRNDSSSPTRTQADGRAQIKLKTQVKTDHQGSQEREAGGGVGEGGRKDERKEHVQPNMAEFGFYM